MTLDEVPVDEPAERTRDRRAAGAGELADELVRQREIDVDAVRVHAPVPVGELPHQEMQALVELRVERYREDVRQSARSAQGPSGQGDADVREGGHARAPPAVEQG